MCLRRRVEPMGLRRWIPLDMYGIWNLDKNVDRSTVRTLVLGSFNLEITYLSYQNTNKNIYVVTPSLALSCQGLI
jgi:hypothetical protein